MFGERSSDTAPWLIIQASSEGVLRFASAIPAARPRLTDIRQIEVQSLPTFTDALQQYERQSGIPLRGRRCVMAVAGVTGGETVSLVRSRWTITRTGLAAVFGEPVTIINNVAARAWAVKSGTAAIETVRGAGAPNLARAGRYMFANIESGVGVAVVDVDNEGKTRILETEGGHMDFMAASECESRLAQEVRGTKTFATWEKILLIEKQDALWARACPEVTDAQRSRIVANALGRFAVNLMHAFGAWQGVLITGGRGGRLLEASNRSAFDAAFADRRNFSRLVMGCPVWKVDQQDAELTGGAECLAQDYGHSFRRAA